MDKFVIEGGVKLRGRVSAGGSKNAALALMPATLLASGNYEFGNIPDLKDISTMGRLLERMGVEVAIGTHSLRLNTFRVNRFEAPYEHVKKMRASIYVLGPLVARYGYAKVSLPGGCAWGPRPVNLHIEGIRKLGATVSIEGGYIIAKARHLKGREIYLAVSSVGATGNLLMAAVLARGTSVIANAAREPEIAALEKFLVRMGARIDGIGTDRLVIEGVDALRPVNETMIPDRIEAGTLLIAAAITGGRIRLEKCRPSHLRSLLTHLKRAGCTINMGEDWVSLRAPAALRPVNATTGIYPGFPTDMQAQWMALMTVARGSCRIADTIYFDRFTHVPELVRLGADIGTEKNEATVHGVRKLVGAKVMSTDLRASASLVIAGLAAEGRTEVLRVYHLDRGYDHLEKKLRLLGADIHRMAGREY
ncbi:MAG TPA: UDP-N-acetylglucosamine 1-carboxyvinyltransferase [Bacteroidota bacterium]|nr:UDP-N-acetylglucosamine 1-carboxyvinyltransferase [Bacteroidota bacterium]